MKLTNDEIEALRTRIAELEDHLEERKKELSAATGGESDHLCPLNFRSLMQIDGGRAAAEFDHTIRQVYENISRSPCVMDDGKPKTQPRQITLTLTLEPEINVRSIPIETANAALPSLRPEIDGLNVEVVVGKKTPSFKATGIKMLTTLRGGQIVAAKFNPHNNSNPAQQEFDFDDE